MGIVVGESLQIPLQSRCGRCQHPRIYLPESFLIGAGISLFYDTLKVAVCITEHAPITCGIWQTRSKHGQTRCRDTHDLAQGIGLYHGHIAKKHQHGTGRVTGVDGLLHRMTRAPLLLLKVTTYLGGRYGSRYCLGVMTHHHMNTTSA